MVRFLLKTLLVKSGEQEGALLLCVARVKKGGGEFLGGGELIGGIRYPYLLLNSWNQIA